MASLNLKGDYGIEILSYYLWGESTPPSNLARKDNRVLIAKDYKARDEKAKITIQASALDYMKFVDRYTSAKVRIAKNSHEFVGENKDIEIGSNQNTIIHKDEIRNIKGNKKEVVEGKLELHVNKGINYLSEEHLNIQAHNYIDNTEQNLSTQTKKQHTERRI